jgi:hypothetical protein
MNNDEVTSVSKFFKGKKKVEKKEEVKPVEKKEEKKCEEKKPEEKKK